MTVRELIAQLQAEDPNRIVIVSRDAEGNSYSPLASTWTGAYAADSTWSGEVGLEPKDLTDERRSEGFTEEDVLKGAPALILSPTY